MSRRSAQVASRSTILAWTRSRDRKSASETASRVTTRRSASLTPTSYPPVTADPDRYTPTSRSRSVACRSSTSAGNTAAISAGKRSAPVIAPSTERDQQQEANQERQHRDYGLAR